MMLTSGDARDLEACMASGGVALFPADTVYGLGCDPGNRTAVERIYELKGRPAVRPAAVMFFSLDLALAALPELEERECAALRALLPGPLTLLLPNRKRRFPLACGPDRDTLGVRVPLLEGPLAALRAVRVPVVQSSANISGEADVRRLADIPASLRDGADLLLDGGELPGTASTVVDLRAYEELGEWRIVRPGPVGAEELERALGSFDPC
ncbi:MAG: L-threonylcarbamoyladenylate synthase [Solirubrobacterales bacterium]